MNANIQRLPSDACRAYDNNGNPRYEVPYKDKKRNGETRPVTIKDIKENLWTPSVTSILQIMAKPELENWKMKEVAKFCADAHFIGDGENLPEWAAWAVDQAKAKMTEARDTGSDVHGEIDRLLLRKQDGTLATEYPMSLHAHAAKNALFELGIWTQRFAIETPFCAGGIAGKVDLKAVPDSLKDAWIVDWKTTSRTLEDGKCPDYDEYCAQLAAYSIGNFGELVPCYNVFLSTSKPGNYLIRKWEKEELDRGWHIYATCRTLWQLKNNYHFIK